MKVSELAQRTSVSPYRLRRYEALGLIHAERGRTGYRKFSETVIREVVFISMSRDVGVSLEDIGRTLPRYRDGSLTFDEMIDLMASRLAEVDQLIAEQRLMRKKILAARAWFEKRKHEQAQRHRTRPASRWPNPRKPAT